MSIHPPRADWFQAPHGEDRITSYNVCYTKLLRVVRSRPRNAAFGRLQISTNCLRMGRHPIERRSGGCSTSGRA